MRQQQCKRFNRGAHVKVARENSFVTIGILMRGYCSRGNGIETIVDL